MVFVLMMSLFPILGLAETPTFQPIKILLNKLEKLYNYLVANKEGIKLYQKREEIKIPEAPEEIEYKHLGTMENNIFDTLASRMNAGKMSWTEKGANNLAKILALKTSEKLNSVVETYFNVIISEEKLAKI
jgi:hypothetical protein